MEYKQRQECSYSMLCKRLKYRDYKYCLQHILQDHNAPYTKCQHISKVTRRRCLNPAIKPDRNSSTSFTLCDHHRCMKTQTSKRKTKLGKSVLSKETTAYETYRKVALNHLKQSIKHQRELVNESDSSEEEVAFHKNERWHVNQSSSWKMGEADIDLQLLEDCDNLLLHNGVLTAEEVVNLSRDSLVRLQAMYIEQFKQLHQELISCRLHYLNNIDEASCSRSSEEIRSMSSFRQCVGPEALLIKQRKEKRKEEFNTDSSLPRPDYHLLKSRCCNVSNHVRCKLPCLPYTKFCVLHIMHDPLQILFKQCSHFLCEEPVYQLNHRVIKQKSIWKDKSFCSIHAPVPNISEDFTTLVSQLQSIVQNPSATGQANDQKTSNLSEEPVDSALQPEDICVVDNFEEQVDSINVANNSKNNENSDNCSKNKTASCCLNDFQPGQCYVMNSCLKKEHQSLHLQEVQGINQTGMPKLGQRLVIKTENAVQHCDEIIPDGSQTAILELDYCKPVQDHGCNTNFSKTAEVEHKGTLLSVSKQQSSCSKLLHGFPKQTYIPPIEKDTLLVDNSLRNMPCLAPVDHITTDDTTADKCSEVHGDQSNNSGNLLSDEVPVAEGNTTSACPNGESDRKPSCPDEETAVASLLSLCTATSHSKPNSLSNE